MCKVSSRNSEISCPDVSERDRGIVPQNIIKKWHISGNSSSNPNAFQDIHNSLGL
jgi:hypothetical protein